MRTFIMAAAAVALLATPALLAGPLAPLSAAWAGDSNHEGDHRHDANHSGRHPHGCCFGNGD